MADSRSKILASIRKSLASERHLPAAPSVALPPPEPAADCDALAQQFADELRKLSGIFVAERMDQVPARVAHILRECGAARVLAWDQACLPVPGLLDHLRRGGVTLVDANIPSQEPARRQRLAEVETVTAGLTGVDAALADTGTLALRSGPGRPRLASLSVQIHLALFTPDQLYASWAAWWAVEPRLADWVSGASNLTLISGPSRTADIEMTLTVGVHGPGELVAILIQA